MTVPKGILGEEETPDSFLCGSNEREKFRCISTTIARIPDTDNPAEISADKDKQADCELESRYYRNDLAASGTELGEHFRDEIS